jgi:tRNA (cytidine/uridine-2'-O-)-methyltransferase
LRCSSPIFPRTRGPFFVCRLSRLEAHIIEPAGFPTTDRAFRRAGMDYLDQVDIVRHPSWEAFEAGAAAPPRG